MRQIKNMLLALKRNIRATFCLFRETYVTLTDFSDKTIREIFQ
jgi:hypothetical protein